MSFILVNNCNEGYYVPDNGDNDYTMLYVDFDTVVKGPMIKVFEVVSDETIWAMIQSYTYGGNLWVHFDDHFEAFYNSEV